MNRTYYATRSIIFFFCFLGCYLHPIVGQNEARLNDFLEKWENSKSYTLECLSLMPADKYTYKPVEDEMDFKDLCIHIINNMIWLSDDYFLHEGFENDMKSLDPTKEELIEIMTSAYEHSAEAVKNLEPHDLRTKVDFFAGEKNLNQILVLLNDHATHHRGQLTVYLRMNGIKPPRYKGW